MSEEAKWIYSCSCKPAMVDFVKKLPSAVGIEINTGRSINLPLGYLFKE